MAIPKKFPGGRGWGWQIDGFPNDFPRIFSVLFLIFLFAVPFAIAAEVQNVRPSQVGNRVLFEYDLEGTEDEAEVSVTIRVGEKTLTMDQLHLEGDFGKVRPGKGKKIYWNVLRDFPRGLVADIKWEIVSGAKTFEDPIAGMEFIFVKGAALRWGMPLGMGIRMKGLSMRYV